MKSEELGVEALFEALSGIDCSATFGTDFLLPEWGGGTELAFPGFRHSKGKALLSLVFGVSTRVVGRGNPDD